MRKTINGDKINSTVRSIYFQLKL